MARLPRLPHALLVGTLAITGIGSSRAQTLQVNGTTTPVNASNVAAAAQAVPNAGGAAESLQLTEAVLANLTSLQLSNVSLFEFGNATAAAKAKRGMTQPSSWCKTTPGDFMWPSDGLWELLNILTGGALIKTVPLGAPCYTNSEYYDAATCEYLLDNWESTELHASNPTSVDSPLYQGGTCLPTNGNDSTCTLGGFPSYAVNISHVYQIQLALNFARALDLRLVVKNTGHDYLGKSLGAYGLSVYTNNLKSIDYIPQWQGQSWDGPAVRMGAGVTVSDMYVWAHEQGLTLIGGECSGVGATGGYATGGGHSPMSGVYGLAADNILSVDVVTPDGLFITCDDENNSDLFWAIRGGGGSTWGVTTSMTFRAYPQISVSGVGWDWASGSGTNNTNEQYWQAMRAYWRRFPEYAANKTYANSFMGAGTNGGYTFEMRSWINPGMPLDEMKAMVAPLFAEWQEIGIDFTPTYFEYDNFYDAWYNELTGIGEVQPDNLRTSNRLFQESNWQNETLLNSTMDALQSIIEQGAFVVQYNMNPKQYPGTTPDSANPAWRGAVMYVIMGILWEAPIISNISEAANKKLTDDWLAELMAVSPGSGGYLNEGDVMQPDFQQAFYGSNYPRLRQIKEEVDPWGLFWAPTAVGSEDFYVADVPTWLKLETGPLCRNMSWCE